MGYSTGRHNAYFADKRKEEEEKKENKRKFSHFQRIQEEIARKEFNRDMMNVCKTCFMVRNSAKQCPYGHPQN